MNDTQRNQIIVLDSKTLLSSLKAAGFDHNHTVVLEAKVRLAKAYFDLGKDREARNLYELLVSGYTEAEGACSMSTIEMKTHLADALRRENRHAKAKEVLDEVESAIPTNFAPCHWLMKKYL